jgi:ParB/RepB/Spo0J family partition protein
MDMENSKVKNAAASLSTDKNLNNPATPAAAGNAATNPADKSQPNDKIKTRQGSGYLKQLYSTARNTSANTHSGLKGLTTFLVNFIPTEKVDASELQVRTHFDDAEIAGLAHSIKEHGVLQPILVVQDGDRYKVIAGERRLRASKMAGIERIPARVITSNDKGVHEIALRENLDRVDLHPLEEGEGYVSLLEAKLYTSHDAIAKAFGKPKSRITECVGFTRLPVATKNSLLEKGIKNRSLLRELLNQPEERHAEIIEATVGKEEVFGIPKSLIANPNAAAGDAKTEDKPTESRKFVVKMNNRGFAIPSFKWKSKKDSPDVLKDYVETVENMMKEIREKFLK